MVGFSTQILEGGKEVGVLRPLGVSVVTGGQGQFSLGTLRTSLLCLSVPAQVSVLCSAFRPWDVMESALTGFLLDTAGLALLLCLAHFIYASFKFTEDGLNWKLPPVGERPD